MDPSRQQLLAGGFLAVSTLVFSVAMWPHVGERHEEVDVQRVLENEGTLEQWVTATLALGICAWAISWTADVVDAVQAGKDPFAEERQ